MPLNCPAQIPIAERLSSSRTNQIIGLYDQGHSTVNHNRDPSQQSPTQPLDKDASFRNSGQVIAMISADRMKSVLWHSQPSDPRPLQGFSAVVLSCASCMGIMRRDRFK